MTKKSVVVKKQAQVEAVANVLKDKVLTQVDKTKVMAEKEMVKVKKQLEHAYSSVEGYAKKNPEKAALVAAGVGAALGAALSLLLSGGKKGKK